MFNFESSHRYLRRALWISGLLWCSAIAFAHPMGNFSINHYAKITIDRDSIEIRYLIDMAEIPTFQEMRQSDIVRDAHDSNTSQFLDKEGQLLKQGISLESDRRPVRLDTESRYLTFADGAGGLPTMKLEFVFRGKTAIGSGAHKLSYLDNNFPGRAGWKEVVVLGQEVEILDSSAPATDRSRQLTNYSSDVLNSPPQQLSAVVDFKSLPSEQANNAAAAGVRDSERPLSPAANRVRRPLESHRPRRASSVAPSNSAGGPTSSKGVIKSPQAVPSSPGRSENTPRSRFTELISNQNKLNFWVLLSAALIAAGLGALHALEPGHGKTVVAAYLVGSRGTARHAVLLGIVVTAAHTAGVYLLGVATLYASRYIVPEQLYPWLGAISGLSVAGLGLFVFLRQWTGESGEHSHSPGERHAHWFLSIFKQAAPNRATRTEPANCEDGSPGLRTKEHALSLRELCMLGVTGGIVPCPAALVVLLSAFSLHRIGFGLFLITAFSCGLAAVLVLIGLTTVYAKRAMSSRLRTDNAALRYLPFLSSAFMVLLGVGITVSSFGSVPSWQNIFPAGKLAPFVTVTLLGLLLGMRHSTDADHVVAVSTIVSRQGSVKSSAIIGLLWGLGHTLTIFLVGSAIIIFGVVIPPRMGLTMEFCVALMLIVLGISNLTGIAGWIAKRTTPAEMTAAAQPAADLYPIERVPSLLERLRDRTAGKLGLYQTIRSFGVGLVHGLAGSAAVALLVLSTIRSPVWSTAYLLVFGFGTMAGMMVMTAAISMPLVYAGKKLFKVDRYMVTLSGVASMVFGIFLVYQIGIVDGLFSAHVHWIPQ